ncbi:MAG: ROK family protein [Chitinophagaceae bacterium]|nr:ROK family protein [Chitinophagaceae bacterium]
MKAIGIDLGGTNIKGILMTEDGAVLKTLQTDTNEKDQNHWKSAIAHMVKHLQNEGKDAAIPTGVSAPGLAGDNNDRIVLMPGRLEGLEHFIWSDHLQTPAWVLNDAHAALMAEAKFGAGKGYKDIVMLTLGTGVGGGVMINGALHQGLLNRAGHLGHITLNADTDFFDVTQMPASLEEVIGNCSIERRSLGRYKSTYTLVQDYRKGDAFATYTWLHAVKRLSVALSGFINIISPQIIILGGGIAEAGDDLFDPLKTFMDIFEWHHSGVRTPVVQATFNEYAGAAGAAAFALYKSKAS